MPMRDAAARAVNDPNADVNSPRTKASSHPLSLQSPARLPMPTRSNGRPVSRNALAFLHRFPAHSSQRILPRLRGACRGIRACSACAVPHWEYNAHRHVTCGQRLSKNYAPNWNQRGAVYRFRMCGRNQTWRVGPAAESSGHVAQLTNETARLKAENLATEKIIQPRESRRRRVCFAISSGHRKRGRTCRLSAANSDTTLTVRSK